MFLSSKGDEQSDGPAAKKLTPRYFGTTRRVPVGVSTTTVSVQQGGTLMQRVGRATKWCGGEGQSGWRGTHVGAKGVNPCHSSTRPGDSNGENARLQELPRPCVVAYRRRLQEESPYML